MNPKVLVYGKAKGWTALGIIDAYLKIYPNATLEDLNKAFPREKFASTKNIDKLLVDLNELEKEIEANGTEREKADAAQSRKIHWYLTLEDGTEAIFHKVIWGEGNFPVLIEWAKQYGIEIASLEMTNGGNERGSYQLYLPIQTQEQIKDFDIPQIDISQEENDIFQEEDIESKTVCFKCYIVVFHCYKDGELDMVKGFYGCDPDTANEFNNPWDELPFNIKEDVYEKDFSEYEEVRVLWFSEETGYAEFSDGRACPDVINATPVKIKMPNGEYIEFHKPDIAYNADDFQRDDDQVSIDRYTKDGVEEIEEDNWDDDDQDWGW